MRPALDPAGHRVPRTKPTCLLHTRRPHRQRPFALVLHLHQHESSRNLHLQYLAKNQSTQRCQSLITQGSDHPSVLEPHMVLIRGARRCLRGARRRLRGARRLSRRLPGGTASYARPRHRLLHRLRGSGRGGEGSHLSGGAWPPSLSSSSSSPDDVYSSVPGEESPCCSRCRNSSLLRSWCSRRRILHSLLRAARSSSRRCVARTRARARGVGGSDRVAFTTLICKEQAKLQDTLTCRKPAKRGEAEVHSPTG
jgi:hypothetical protein